MIKIRDKWFHFFGSLILCFDIYRNDDFGNVIDIITSL